MKEKIISEKTLLRKSIIAFAVFIVAIGAGYYGWKQLRTESDDAGVQKTLRKGLSVNEKIFSAAFDSSKLVKTYPKSEANQNIRYNGGEGLRQPLDTAAWRLQVVKKNGDTILFTMDDITKLPKTEVVFDFKCIEGWSRRTWWGGVRFSDFIKHYKLEEDAQLNYTGLLTPDRVYFVGIDRPSMMHSQTLLCYEVNGKPLPLKEGYPLRLIIPVKYGIKHLKRIGTIFFSNEKPPDYWAERGYDYYAGH